MSPQGQPFAAQQDLRRWAGELRPAGVALRHYEGFDERIRGLADEGVLSIGDFVLTGRVSCRRWDLLSMALSTCFGTSARRCFPGTRKGHTSLFCWQQHPHLHRPSQLLARPGRCPGAAAAPRGAVAVGAPSSSSNAPVAQARSLLPVQAQSPNPTPDLAV